ncbi:MAG TPA: C39 family peptidase [Candidatus Tetragenococcus pullicola]|nr:C39 family peptidase [Candidatus Tetragenococcus pullicola]
MKLTVPLIPQRPEMPTGCEIAACAMLIQSAGVAIDKVALAKEIPYSDSDCNQGFVGNPFTEDGQSIYPPALLETMRNYVGSAVDLSGRSINELKTWLKDTHHPIEIWLGPIYDFGIHALVLIGYEKGQLIFNDCWMETEIHLSDVEFLPLWENKGRLALSY